ncbi:MAG: polyprenol monophosphomannose synthase [Schleiferiaceae bacterium]|jgi:dolichol-phosphate mannosyltransferase|nr:polyprenol monophosphomannose synthase [Schleiferiaceae bacterium]MDP4759606.1 polyprenol monophosphomannose synthase [Schleiferiaceae bacterium]MDP4767366.1 polyprenol monophosphomannose synthase [Schleiferiaceae bacterium]MDP4877618.1 polyprenol monophosphomannose synthase [Schleiferiaceae bacterium]MDP4959146.1 polyprenol monophosphomannose synthase [Schleiferiaceae bacterium]
MSRALVIIPTYNEIENIEKMLNTVMALPGGYEVLIVDDGSPDGTADVVRKLMDVHGGRIHLEERTGKLGLGTAYIHGFKWALAREYAHVFEMDCDFSHNPEDLPRLLEACENGADVSIGSRYVQGVNVVNWPMSRVLLSYFASVYVRFITGMPIQDATAGFKCYTRETLAAVDFSKIHFVGYAFQIEMKFTAWRKGLVVKEVPVIFTDRTEGTSKMSSGIIKEAIFGVMKLKIWSWFTKP